MAADLHVGDVVLGSFRLLRQLGAGSFATAYLAEQLGTDRKAVVKVPHLRLLEGNQAAEVRRRFEIEARAATRAMHPNLVTIFTVGTIDDDVPAIAMEFVEGEELARRLSRRAPLPLAEIYALGEQLGEALAALHEVGIVHRDLSPSNVIVRDSTAGLVAKILDLGVAKVLDAPTRTLGPMGTPGYLAPEQLVGKVTPRSDVYSLGAILWWALTGHPRPDDYHDGGLARQVGSTTTPDPLELRPDAPSAVAAIISRMLVPDASVRPTVHEFLRAWPRAFEDLTPDAHGPQPSWARTTTPAHAAPVAILIHNPVLRALVAGYLANMVEVVSCEVLDLLHAAPGTHAVAVIDADLPEVDARAAIVVLRERHEGLHVIVIGGADHAATNWRARGAREFIVIPAGLGQLGERVAEALGRSPTTASSSTGRLSEEVVGSLRIDAPRELLASLDSLVGHVPQWLAELHVALESADSHSAMYSCGQLLSAAECVGATKLASLARAAHGFAEQGDMVNTANFVDALEAEYHHVFREVFSLMGELRQSEAAR